MVSERSPSLGEHLLEHPPHREYGRTGIDLRASDLGRAHLAAGLAGTLDDGDVQSARSQQQGGHQAADPGTDHQHAGVRMCPRPPRKKTLSSASQSVYNT